MRFKILAVLFLACSAHAISRQDEPDFNTTDSIGNVSVSTSAWTRVPATNSTSRLAIIVQNYPTNTASMLVRISTSTQNPGGATQAMTLRITDAPWVLSLSDGLYLWMKSNAASAENVFFQEMK